MKRLNNKIALITGAGSGIGQSAALLFAKEGATVVVVDLNGDKGEKTRDMILKMGGEALFIHANITRETDCQDMINITEKKFGKLDVLFNNAGIMHHKDTNAVDLDDKTWDLTMNINVKGIFHSCKYGIPALQRSGGGSIINMASFVALLGSAKSNLAYTASKGAVVSLSRELAICYAPDNIRVNALCPGPISTEAFREFIGRETNIEYHLKRIPLKRFGRPEEVANCALYLASDESSYVTGSVLMVDGGITATYLSSD